MTDIADTGSETPTQEAAPTQTLGNTTITNDTAPSPSSEQTPLSNEGLATPQTPPVEDWRATVIPEDLQKEAIFSNVKDPHDLARQFANAQKLIGVDRLAVPGEDSPSEVWDRFYEAGGRPAAPEGYTTPDITELFGEGRGFDPDVLSKYQEHAHKSGLSQSQLSANLEFFAEYTKEVETANIEATKARIDSGLKVLRDEWGTSEQYDQNMDLAVQAFNHLAGDSLKELVQSDDGVLLRTNPDFIKHFLDLGKDLADKRSTIGGSGGSGAFESDSPILWQQKLSEFETANSKVLLKMEEDGSPLRDPRKHAKAIAQREELLKKAYPSVV